MRNSFLPLSPYIVSIQFSSVTQLCLTLCNFMDCSMPGFPAHHQLPELTQTHIHWVTVSIPSSHPLLSLSALAFNLSLHQDLFQWVSSLHQVAKVLEFQLQHQSFQWIFTTDFLYGWLIWSCSPRDSWKSSPTPQLKSINSSVLNFLGLQFSHRDMFTAKTLLWLDGTLSAKQCLFFLICCLGWS